MPQKKPGVRPPAKKTKKTAGETSRSKKESAEPNPRLNSPDPTQRISARRTRGEGLPVVGVGASAGGLEAFTQLLESLPDDTGMAFVLVCHLSHTHKSLMSELLSRETRMPVGQVTSRTRVEANHVYVIPPNMELSIGEGYLLVSPLPSSRRPQMVIDSFLRSLAESRQSQAIGVILSGTGTDGTLGLAAIKAEGGITFAQDQESAKYPDMPRSASSQPGSADFVLPPAQIAKELVRIARHPYFREVQPATPVEATPADELGKVFTLIKTASGVDFTHYKPATIRRRISRRMVLHKIDTPSAYIRFLESTPSELHALYQDLLINVTGFFRDKETFETIERQVIPAVLKDRSPDDPIRVWVPGCATGEEAYSLAICFLGAMADLGANPPLQIFATDISAPSLQRAREGAYTENIALDVTPERLRRYFVKSGQGGYQISKMVRDLCVFAVQNVVKDPPFSRMDLISCRNLLIYFDSKLQRKVIGTFHYALNPAGFLLLGASETVGAASELFRQIDKKHRIYSKLYTAARPELDFGPREAELQSLDVARTPRGRGGILEVEKIADRVILGKYAPAGVVVNSDFDIVQFRGHTGPFLEPSPGQASLNVMKMAREGLLMDLRSALHEAKAKGEPVHREGLQVYSNGGKRSVNIDVIPLAKGAENQFLLVLFHEGLVTKKVEAVPKEAERARGKAKRTAQEKEIHTLREELASSQDDLHSIIEEQEATNEELQSANEEILSSNEELQSTNEELETAKEELQATNEELTTVNEEMQNRNVELASANSDLNNLISSVDIVYIMLGNDLRIRRFTPVAQKVLNLIPGDIGRPISDIRLSINVPHLAEMIADVIDSVSPKVQEVQDARGRWFSMSIRPYKSEDNRIDGAVLALVDIDEVKRAQQALRESEESWRRLVEEAPDFILSADREGKVLFLNRTIVSLGREAVVGDSIYDVLEPAAHETVRKGLEKVIMSGEVATFETESSRLRDTPRLISRAGPIKADGKVVAVTLTTREAPASNGE